MLSTKTAYLVCRVTTPEKKELRLGGCHAYKLFDGMDVKLKPGKEFPKSYSDFEALLHIEFTWEDNLITVEGTFSMSTPTSLKPRSVGTFGLPGGCVCAAFG